MKCLRRENEIRLRIEIYRRLVVESQDFGVDIMQAATCSIISQQSFHYVHVQ
jgi:hypothetical protein